MPKAIKTTNKKFTVYLMIPCMSWEGVKAKDIDDAISQCQLPGEIPGEAEGEPHTWIAKKEND